MDMANSTLFNYREASRQHRSQWQSSSKKGKAGYALSKLAAFFKASFRDRYGLLRFDVMIAGPDMLLNLILAHKAVSGGKSVAIYHGESDCWEGAEDVQRLRLSTHETAFTEVIESLLGFDKEGMPEGTFREKPLAEISNPDTQYVELLKEIGFQTDRHWNIAPSYFLSGCAIEDDRVEHLPDQRRYLLRDSEHCEVYPSIDRLAFWAESWKGRFDSLRKTKPQYAIEVNEVWWTGIPTGMRAHKSEGSVKDRYYGDAKWPLSSFRQFVGNDRMRDILHALRED